MGHTLSTDGQAPEATRYYSQMTEAQKAEIRHDAILAIMDDAKLAAAVETVLSKHPREVVIVYLHAFYEMNEARWPNLKALLESDPRLQFTN